MSISEWLCKLSNPVEMMICRFAFDCRCAKQINHETKRNHERPFSYDDEFQTFVSWSLPTSSAVWVTSRLTSWTTCSAATEFVASSSRHRRRSLNFLRTQHARCAIFTVVIEDASRCSRWHSADVDVDRTSMYFRSRDGLDPDAAAAPVVDDDAGRCANFSIAVTVTSPTATVTCWNVSRHDLQHSQSVSRLYHISTSVSDRRFYQRRVLDVDVASAEKTPTAPLVTIKISLLCCGRRRTKTCPSTGSRHCTRRLLTERIVCFRNGRRGSTDRWVRAWCSEPRAFISACSTLQCSPRWLVTALEVKGFRLIKFAVAIANWHQWELRSESENTKSHK